MKAESAVSQPRRRRCPPCPGRVRGRGRVVGGGWRPAASPGWRRCPSRGAGGVRGFVGSVGRQATAATGISRPWPPNRRAHTCVSPDAVRWPTAPCGPRAGIPRRRRAAGTTPRSWRRSSVVAAALGTAARSRRLGGGCDCSGSSASARSTSAPTGRRRRAARDRRGGTAGVRGLPPGGLVFGRVGAEAAALVAATDKIAAALADHEPRILSLAADGGAACELTGFLNYLICGELRRDLPAMSRSLSGRLPGCDLRRGSDGLSAARPPAARLYRAVAVGSWPMVASGAALGEVLALDGDIEVAQVCRPWDADKALLLHERQVGRNRRR